jgi:hypothetical protein
MICQIEGTLDLRTHGRDPHDIRFAVEVDVIEELIDECNVMLRRGEGLQVGKRDATGPIARRFVKRAGGTIVSRGNQVDAHCVVWCVRILWSLIVEVNEPAFASHR